jgi:hypothetical protein
LRRKIADNSHHFLPSHSPGRLRPRSPLGSRRTMIRVYCSCFNTLNRNRCRLQRVPARFRPSSNSISFFTTLGYSSGWVSRPDIQDIQADHQDVIHSPSIYYGIGLSNDLSSLSNKRVKILNSPLSARGDLHSCYQTATTGTRV